MVSKCAAIVMAILLTACKGSAATRSGGEATQEAAASAPTARTKLESFSVKYGVVLVRGFTEVGTVPGQYGGHIEVDAVELTNVRSGEKQRGVTIEVKEGGSLERSETAYIDYDEVDSLLSGIDFISKADHSQTSLKEFQADYNTRGDLHLSTFSTGSSGISAAVKAGRIAGTRVFLSLDDLAVLRARIADAKKTLDSLQVTK